MCFKYVPPDPDDDGPALDTFFANVLKNLPERIERQRNPVPPKPAPKVMKSGRVSTLFPSRHF